MWIVRFTLLGVLVVLVCTIRLLLRRRSSVRLIENRAFNVLVVALYNACCYLIAALPPGGGGNYHPAWLVYPGFVALGTFLIGLGLVLAGRSLAQRKVLGLQNVQAGLLSSGAYKYFRHPIYTAILLIALGLALATRNPDGLLMFPALVAANMAIAIGEERFDMGVRFGEQYREYRRTTSMFGPPWLWLVIGVAILLVAGLGLLS